jgi:hypothetical protein
VEGGRWKVEGKIAGGRRREVESGRKLWVLNKKAKKTASFLIFRGLILYGDF